MFLVKDIPHSCAIRSVAAAVSLLLAIPAGVHALVRGCDADPTTSAALNACITKYGTPVNSPLDDTLVIHLAKGLKFTGAQIVIDAKKNIHLLGDTVDMPNEATLPFIVYQDRTHTNSDTSAIKLKNEYWEYNGALLVNESRNILVRGVGINGAGDDSTATTNKIFAFCAGYSTTACVDIKGNFGVNIRNSYGVIFRGGAVLNTWYGVGIQGRNLGGAFSYPTPLDPVSQINATLPTSRSGLYGKHIIEMSRFHDNTWGTLFEYDWDLGSTVRNNLYYNNYLRAYGTSAFPGYIRNLSLSDAKRNTLGQQYALKWNIVGGAFFMNGVALTPYRIHNNTFNNNGVTVGAYYMAGTQHLFYNNLIGKPYKYYNAAMSADAEASTYTQTERATEMLQFYSEHQRSNLIVPQDGAPKSTTTAADPFAQDPNFRLFRMKMNRSWNTPTRNPPPPATSNWRGNAQGWSNNTSDQDSLAMTWVPQITADPISTVSDTGGLVEYIRHNMYGGAFADPYDKDPETSAYGLPYMPLNIHDNLLRNTVFRNVLGFNLRWTNTINWGSTTPTSTSFLRPLSTNASTAKTITGKGWPVYDGQVAAPLDIGALSTSAGGWAVPDARLVLQDTLIEMMQGDTIGFRMDISGEGFTSADIVDLKVAKAKFYYDVPVADTTFNAGGCRAYSAGQCTSGNDTTRVNSILSSKPWPIADSTIDYNTYWHLDDTLKAGKLRSTHFFIGKLSKGALPDSVYYARAEVVLQATLKDGRVVYSNPGVFMYSRPRFQLDVVLTDENGNPLPMDIDGYSRQVIAGQKVIMHVTPKFDSTAISSTVAFKDLQMGQTTLMGKDTANPSLERDSTANNAWQKIRPNQILQPKLGRRETTTDTLRFTEAGLVGSLTLRALFDVEDQRFLQGISKRLRVIAASIYQATIDSVFINNKLIVAPKPTVKRALDLVAGGAGLRDTLLKAMVGTRLDSTGNISHYGEDGTGLVRMVLQVRDAFGNPVNDSVAAGLLVKLQVVSNAVRFANGLGANPLELNSVTVPGTGIRAFDTTGRVVFDSITVGSILRAGVIFPMRSMVVLNTAGFPEIGAGTARPGIPDTSWIQAAPSAFGLVVTDTLGKLQTAVTGVVGTLVPVRVKVTNSGKGLTGSLTVSLTADPALKYYADPTGTTPITSIAIANDSVTPIIWVRAIDTARAASIGGTATVGSDAVSARVTDNVFTFPRLRQASFHDADCDGYIDSLVLRFLDPVKFRTAAQTALGDSIDVLFPNEVLTPSANGLVPRTGLMNDTIITLAWNPATMSAASLRANRIVLTNPLGGSPMVLAPQTIFDKAPPVAQNGSVLQKWVGQTYVSTITVSFSEEIDTLIHPAGALLPFNVKRGGVIVRLDSIPTASKVIMVQPGTYTWTVNGRVGLIQPGDSLIVSGAMIQDLAGNTTGDLCANKPFPTILVTGAVPYDVIILDQNGDGNGDHLRVSYHDSIGTLPASFFLRWGTPAETLTVTAAMLVAQGVKSSDSNFTISISGWTGQDIVVDGDAVHAPRTVGPADTASFYSGAVKVRIRDGIAPVLIHARLFYDRRANVTSTVDTLRLTFSEAIAGCPAGTDVNSCLDLKVPSATNVKFPTGSTVISVVGDVMLVAVPSSGSNTIGVGDSLRALSSNRTGLVTDGTWDSRANKVGDSAAWVPVRADRRPPSHGWFIDENGDGRVEAVVLSYNRTFSDTSLPDFSFTWGGKSIKGGAWTSLDGTKLLWKVSLVGAFDYGVTGDASSSKVPAGTQTSLTTYGFFVYDSVGPVLLPGARLVPGAGKSPADTLYVQPSESVLDPTGKLLVAFRHGSHQIPDDSVRVQTLQRLADGRWMIVIDPNSPWRPSAGDSVRLSVTGSVHDTTRIGTIPHVKHAWVMLSGPARPPYDAVYLDNNGDGRIETWTADFVTPPVVGTILRVLDPAGSGSYREYTVTQADSAKTHFEIALDPTWAQDVTSLYKADLGRLYLPGAATEDTTHFDVRDGVPAVIKSAYLGYTSDTTKLDTLRIVFSEKVSIDLANFQLVWKLANGNGDSTLIKAESVIWDSTTNTMVLLLKPMPTGADADKRPEKGDLVRILDNGALKDVDGNTPQPIAKWTLVTGTRRIFPPKLGLTNTMVNLDPSKTQPGTPDLRIVWRKPSPGTDANSATDWSDFDGSGNRVGVSYGQGSNGTILHLETNVPTSLALYIYDLAGTYVTSKQVEITQEDIDRLNASLGTDSTRASTINMIDVGFVWDGRSKENQYVGTGIYVVRIIAFRGPTPEERSLGASGIQATNYLQKIGVKAKKD